jgi:hypothetical protein
MKGPAESGLILGVDLRGTTLAGGVVNAAGTVWNSRAVPMDWLGRGEGSLKNPLAPAAFGRLLVRMPWRLLTCG